MIIVSRNIILFFLLAAICFGAFGQQLSNIDSLKKQLRLLPDDSNKVRILYNLSFAYVAGSYADSALIYSRQSLALAENIRYEPGIFWSEITLGAALAILGNYPAALEADFKTLDLATKLNQLVMLCYANGSLAECYHYMGDYNASVSYAWKVLQIMPGDDRYWMYIQLSKDYSGLARFDSAVIYARKAYESIRTLNFAYAQSVICPVLGNAYAGKGQYDSALKYYRLGIPRSLASHTQTHTVDDFYGIAGVYYALGQSDSALAYCRKILDEKIVNFYPAGLQKADSLLSGIYESMNKPDSAFKYYKNFVAVKEELSNRQKTVAVQNLIYREQEKENEINRLKKQFQQRLLLGAAAIIVLAGAIAAFFWYRARRRMQLQRMRNNIAADLHDDIGSTLSSIGIMSELAIRKPPQASQLLSSISESTSSIQENMSDIVWAIRSENDTWQQTVQRMHEFAAGIVNARAIDLDFQTDQSLGRTRMNMQQRRNFYLFFKEAVNNAAKYSGAKKITVKMNRELEEMQMTVNDDGIGFDPDQVTAGNGMLTMKRRAEELRGQYILRSAPRQGTTVGLRFKIT